MRFLPDFLDRLKDTISISQVIARYVTFDEKKSKASKGEFWACCPFHQEKTPSFRCDDKKARYNCFGCHEHGDVINFIQAVENLTFNEAVEKLANMAGLPMPKMDKQTQQVIEKRASLYQIMNWAVQFFIQQLHSYKGEKAVLYLKERQIRSDIQSNFNIGYAPAGARDLIDFLISKGATEQQIVDCGLALYSDDKSQIYPRFKDRLMFPIMDSKGRCIAFGGRAFNSAALAKYLNSPETILFKKSEVIYNFSMAREYIASKEEDSPYDEVIVVEGYMDTVALSQSGFRKTVAILGTALTEQQMQLLWKLSDFPLLCMDGDKAGIAATYRVIEKSLPLINSQKSLRFLLLPDGADPDDFIKTNGQGAFAKQISKAYGFFDMLWYLETRGKKISSPEALSSLRARIQRLLMKISDSCLKDAYLQALKDRLWAMRPSSFSSAGKKFGKVEDIRPSDALVKKLSGPRAAGQITEASLIKLLLAQPFLVDLYSAEIMSCELKSSYALVLREAMVDIMAHVIPKDTEEFKKMLLDRQQQPYLAHLEKVAAPYKLIWQQYERYDRREALECAKKFLMSLGNRAIEKELEELKEEYKADPEIDIVSRINALKDGYYHG